MKLFGEIFDELIAHCYIASIREDGYALLSNTSIYIRMIENEEGVNIKFANALDFDRWANSVIAEFTVYYDTSETNESYAEYFNCRLQDMEKQITAKQYGGK
jgi:hypothetical protein